MGVRRCRKRILPQTPRGPWKSLPGFDSGKGAEVDRDRGRLLPFVMGRKTARSITTSAVWAVSVKKFAQAVRSSLGHEKACHWSLDHHYRQRTKFGGENFGNIQPPEPELGIGQFLACASGALPCFTIEAKQQQPPEFGHMRAHTVAGWGGEKKLHAGKVLTGSKSHLVFAAWPCPRNPPSSRGGKEMRQGLLIFPPCGRGGFGG